MDSGGFVVPPPPAQWLPLSVEEFYFELASDHRLAPLFRRDEWLPIEWVPYWLQLCIWFRTHRYSRRGFA